MMKKQFLISLLIPFILLSCNDFKSGKGGLAYKIIEDKGKEKMKDFAFVSLSLEEETESGKPIFNTGFLDPRPIMMYKVSPEFDGDFNTALQYLGEGDSAVLHINVDSLKKMKNYQLPNSDASKYIVYKLRINKVITREGRNDSLFNEAIESFKENALIKRREEEKQKIANYINAKKLVFDSTATGLFILKSTKKASITKPSREKVVVNYSIASLDGKVYETNVASVAKRYRIFNSRQLYQPLEVKFDKLPSSGFREAIALTQSGETAKFIIPSKLAYGKLGSKYIEPYTPLLCEVEVVK